MPAPRVPPVPDISAATKAVMGGATMICLVTSLETSSAFGPGIIGASQGVFAPTATLLAPDRSAFLMWTLVFVGLFGLSVRIWMPGQNAHLRRRRLIWPAIGTTAAMSAWMWCASSGLVWLTLPLILLSLVGAVATLESVRRIPPPDLTAHVVVEGTFGLATGWLLVATIGNAATLLAAAGALITGPANTVLSVLMLVVAAVGAVAGTLRYRGNWSIAVAFCWGMLWLIRARSHDGPPSLPVVVTAFAAAVFVAASPLLVWADARVRGVRAS